jgi:hypothetical protein
VGTVAGGDVEQVAGSGAAVGRPRAREAAGDLSVVVDGLDQEQLRQRLGGQRLVGLAGELVDAGAGGGQVGVVPAHGRVQG